MTMQNHVTVRRIKAGAPTVTRQEPAPFKARPMPEPTDCGHGKCAREPACTNRCAYKLAHIAMTTHHTQTPAEREAANDIRAFQAEADGLKLLATMVLGVFVLLIIGAAVAAWGA